MTDLARLVVSLEAQTAQYQQQLERAEKRADRFKKRVKNSLTGVQAAFGAFAIGAAVNKIVSATAKQEEAVQQLRQGLASTNNVVGLSLEELTRQAADFQKATKFGDEDIIRAQSQLVTFTNITGQQFTRTTQAALDLSERMGQDLKSSVVQLGKALNDPIANLSALSRTGIQFSEDQKETIKTLVTSGKLMEAQEVILKELETQFGGSAKAAGQTFGGALAGLKNDLGDLLEADGGLPGATGAVNDLRAAVQDEGFKQGFAAITQGAITAVSAIVEGFSKAIKVTQFLAESLAAKINGPAIGDLPRINAALEKENTLRERLVALRDQARGGERAAFNERIAELDTEINRLNTLKELSIPSPAPAIQLPENPAQPSTPEAPADTGGAISGGINTEAVEAAAAQKRAELAAVKAVEEEFRAVEAEQKLEREAIEGEEKAVKFEGETQSFLNHQQSLTGILAGQVSKRLGIEKTAAQGQISAVGSAFSQVTSIMGREGKKSEKLQKAMRIKEAISATHAAAINSYNALAGIPIVGPALGAAAAAVAIAYGFKRVSAIKSGSSGSSGTPNVSSPSIPTTPSGGVSADPANLPAAPQSKDINVRVEGEVLQPGVLRKIMEGIGEQLGDGVNMNLEFV